ncbi:MAG TPA: hypothetical protein VFS16_00045 [Acidimicrobiia bacterium]|nr:hypothetical protein [Acidimicrobiia bacterium]
MPDATVLTVAVITPAAVAAGLARQFLAARVARREIDSYLRWLLDEAAGPVTVTRPCRWPAAVET